MSEKKMNEILTVLQGITYLEWRKIKQVIDDCFIADVNAAANKVILADVDRIAKSYKREF